MTTPEGPSVDGWTGGGPGEGSPRVTIRETLTGELKGLYRFAAARLGRRAHLAEDVVQQALVAAMAHGRPPADVDSQRAWLRGIVHNVIRREFRSQSRRGRVMDAVRTNVRSDAGGDPAGPDDEVRRRRVHAIHLAVTELAVADQDLFYAFYHAGRSHACIAAELGTTTKGVETRLYRLRTRLRAALEWPKECPA